MQRLNGFDIPLLSVALTFLLISGCATVTEGTKNV